MMSLVTTDYEMCPRWDRRKRRGEHATPLKCDRHRADWLRFCPVGCDHGGLSCPPPDMCANGRSAVLRHRAFGHLNVSTLPQRLDVFTNNPIQLPHRKDEPMDPTLQHELSEMHQHDL